MSEPKRISPLLDGFLMGDPISDHDGVRCCPAMEEATGKKYIVKIISVPASGAKLEALLLAGAFSDKASALAYFKDLSEGVVEEAVLLERLSRLEGFTPYERWQVVPKEDDEGYDVYLLGAYRPTLERHLSRSPMTHLNAVNLGLDLCAALAVCRRSGHLYVDLKPSNIFICDDHEYRIGDLGFVALSSLQYASLPEKYHSIYTAPEITDAYSALNTTLDIYAVGLTLYQVYNNGVLPFEGHAPAQLLMPPEYADYEMAAIILKACAPNPEERWQDPTQMGQALVSYLQKNTVNDTPIVPPAVPIAAEPAEAEAEQVLPEEPTTEEILSEVDQALEAVGVDPQAAEEAIAQAPADGETEPESDTAADAPAEESAAEDAAEEPMEDIAEDMLPDEDTSVETSAGDASDEDAEQPADEDTLAEEPTAEEIASEEAEEVVSEKINEAEAAENESSVPSQPREDSITDEVSQMLAQADELIAHETPEPVVAPAPIDVPIPPRIVLPPEDPQEDSPEETAEPAVSEGGTEAATAEDAEPEVPEPEAEPPADEDVEEAEDIPYEQNDEKPKSGKGLITALVCIILAAALTFGGYLFYRYYYLQTIENISLHGTENQLTVSLTTDVDDSLLSVVCTDAYGNTKRENVSNGVAVFEDLNPDTRYKVQVEISGFHKLIGATSSIHITQEQTSIVSFSAVTGAESGSVILNFTIQGPETNEWKVTYFAEGEETKTVTFPGHMVTISGLTVGKHYTFQLEPTSELYIVGNDTVEFTVSKILYAENLTILGFSNSALTAVWDAPAGESVESWTVRCYNDAGYDKTVTVTETTAVFEELNPSAAYTVEVSAVGMSLGSRAYVSANSVTVQNLKADTSDPSRLKLSWDFEGTAPEGGWLVLYTVSGISEQQVVQCTEPAVEIIPMIPGSEYTISIQTASGSTVFGGALTLTAPEAKKFSGYDIAAKYIEFSMCRTPNKEKWDKDDVKKKNYTTEFAVGESASFVVSLEHEYSTSSDKIITLFLIRDAEGNIVSCDTQTRTWTSMWYRGSGTFTIPAMPTTAGSYTVAIYFNGQYVTSQDFTVK